MKIKCTRHVSGIGLSRYVQIRKTGKPNTLKVFRNKTIKRPKSGNSESTTSHWPAKGEHQFNNNEIIQEL